MLDVLMLIAAWVLGGRAVSKANQEQRWLAVAGFLLIASVMTVLLFAGLGPPPHDAQQWLQTAADQKIRYTLLVLDGLLVAAGLTVLRESLRQAGEQGYSALGFAGIIIATAFYVLDMTHFRAHEFVARVQAASESTPDWAVMQEQYFTFIGLVEVALTYLAVAAFAAALGKVAWMGRNASRALVAFNLVAASLVVVSPMFPSTAKLGLPVFVLAVPAVPFFMPYLIGVNLLRRAGDL